MPFGKVILNHSKVSDRCDEPMSAKRYAPTAKKAT